MPDLDPAHVEAVARALLGRTATSGARQILTSTDPDVHAAMLAALVRAGVLDVEASGGPIEPEGKRRYVTDWEEEPG